MRALASALAAATWLACGARSALDLPVNDAAVDAGVALDAAEAVDAARADSGEDASEDADVDSGIPPRDSGVDSGAIVDASSPPDADACAVGCTPPMPAAPRPIAPLSTATVTSHTPLLRWALAPGSDGARVDICRDRACATLLTSFSAAGSSATPPTALTQGVYFWRLRGMSHGVVGTDTSHVWELFVGVRSAPVSTSWTTALDVDGDGFADAAVVMGNDKVLVYLGAPGGLSAAPVTLAALPTGPSGVVAPAGDVNGDGFGDLLVAGGGAGVFRGVYLYLGGPSFGTSAPVVIPNPDAVINTSFFGWDLAGADDVNGDGYADVVIGDPFGEAGRVAAVYVYYGGPSGLATTPLAFENAAYGYADAVAGVGDVNGDGYADIAAASNPGLFVFLGGPNGPGAPTRYRALTGNDSLAGGTDVNGDGYADVVIGEPDGYYDNSTNRYEGAVEVHLGGPNGIATIPILLLDPMGGEGLGHSAATAGDTNGDGFGDIVVSAYRGPMYGGPAYVYLGNAGGVSPTPIRLGYTTGSAVSGGGDFDGDGFADVISVSYITSVEFYLGGAGGPGPMPTASMSLYGVQGGTL